MKLFGLHFRIHLSNRYAHVGHSNSLILAWGRLSPGQEMSVLTRHGLTIGFKLNNKERLVSLIVEKI